MRTEQFWGVTLLAVASWFFGFHCGHHDGVQEGRRQAYSEVNDALLDGFSMYDPEGDEIQRWDEK